MWPITEETLSFFVQWRVWLAEATIAINQVSLSNFFIETFELEFELLIPVESYATLLKQNIS